MKAVWTTGSRKKKSKYIFIRCSGPPSDWEKRLSTHIRDRLKNRKLNCEDREIVCFSSFSALNDKKNLEYIKNVSTIERASSVGGYSYCHKIKKNIFLIDNDQDGSSPTVYQVYKKKETLRFFINCGSWDPEDYFEKALKIKKKSLTSNFTIKDNKFVIFALPDMDNRFCKTQFNKKDLKEFSSDFNNFIENRKDRGKLLEFEVPNGTYNIYSFWGHETTGDDDVAGHLVELKK